MKLKELFEANNQRTFRVVLTYKGKVERPPYITKGANEEDATKNIENVFKMSRVSYIEPWDAKHPGVFKVGDKVIFVKPSERIRVSASSKLDSYGHDVGSVDKKDDNDIEGVITRIHPNGKFADVDFDGNGLAVHQSDLRLKF